MINAVIQQKENTRLVYCLRYKSPEDLRNSVNSYERLITFLNNLPEKDRFKFCDLLGTEHLKKLVQTESKEKTLLEIMDQKDHLSLQIRLESFDEFLKHLPKKEFLQKRNLLKSSDYKNIIAYDFEKLHKILLVMTKLNHLENFCYFIGQQYLQSTIVNLGHLDTVLLLFPKKRQLSLCNFLGQELVRSLINSFQEFKNSPCMLNENKDEFLKWLIPTPLAFETLLLQFPGNDRIDFCRWLDLSFLKKLTKGNQESAQTIASVLPQKNCFEFFKQLGQQYLRSTVFSLDKLNKFLFRFSKEDRLPLCKLLGQDFVSSLIHSSQEFECLLRQVNENTTEFLQWLIPTLQDLATLLSQFKEDDRINLCRWLDLSFLEELIGDDPEKARTIALALPQKDRFEFCERLGIDVFYDHSLLSTLFKDYPFQSLLPEEQYTEQRITKKLREIAEENIPKAEQEIIRFKFWAKANNRDFNEREMKEFEEEMEENRGIGFLPK
ncbi:MAG: hypothetical protein KKA99_04460 [Gammaproteobacteria bacterium]|nr:hypothetical protein [Gammaproteobacteria bacterium]MBU1629178.1 hypothetical protein [Gammaproteobacteria bacterium]